MSTNSGFYMYGVNDEIYKKVLPLYFAEGASSTVLSALFPDNTVGLRVNGKTDASTRSDMSMQLGAAYFPRFIRPHARDILVIGFGSGTTSGTSLLFPEAQVTCCEIEPAVYGTAKFFEQVNHQPYEHSLEFLKQKKRRASRRRTAERRRDRPPRTLPNRVWRRPQPLAASRSEIRSDHF